MFQEWSRNRYGVFPEHGFAGDEMYPDKYEDGRGQVRSNLGCNLTISREKMVRLLMF